MGLRILLQCIYYPPEVGGLESHVAGLSEGLVRRGHYVDMLTSRSQADLKASERVAGVNIHRVWMPSKTPTGWIAHTMATLPTHRRLARRADVVHAHTFASGAAAALAPVDRPLVLTLHTSHFLIRARKPFWRRVFRRVIAASDYLLATSEEIMQVAQAIQPHARSEVITNAVDTDLFAAAAAPPEIGPRLRIIVPRRLYAKNGVEYFVRAMPLILSELDAEARVVGDGPEREKLRALASELGVAGRVDFLGARSHAEMPDLLRTSDIAVIPSLMEATSIAALEAMSCGLPVAASAVGGLPEIIDDAVGVLFEPGKPEALAAAVVGLVRRSDFATLGCEGRRRVVERWSQARLVERHLQIYSELVNGTE